MKRITWLLFLGFVCFMFFVPFSCKKAQTDNSTQSATDNNIAESEFTRIMPTVNNFAIKEHCIYKTDNTGCPVVTPPDTTMPFPRTLTVDYGSGCVDSIDGKTRKGKLIMSFSNYWDSVGTTVTVTLQNYYVNNIHYEGTVTIVKNLHSFTTTVTGGKCTGSNGSWVIKWEGTRTVTQIAGANTPFNVWDDVYSITGNESGTNRKGKTYTVTITSPLIKKTVCSWIEQGTIELTPEGLSTRTLDFGNGTCDNKATVTINGNTYTIYM